jgi:hypothetical protein
MLISPFGIAPRPVPDATAAIRLDDHKRLLFFTLSFGYSSIFTKKLFSDPGNNGSPSLPINSPANVFIRYFSGR